MHEGPSIAGGPVFMEGENMAKAAKKIEDEPAEDIAGSVAEEAAVDLEDPSTWPESAPEPEPEPTPQMVRTPPPQRYERPERQAPRPFNFPAPPPRLQFGRLVGASHKWRTLAADIPAGTDIEQMLVPEYWAHHVDAIEPNDIVVCVCEDGTWEAWYRVTSKFTSEVHLSPIMMAYHETGAEAPISDMYEVRWISGPKRWGVIRSSDKTLIKDELQTQSQAHAWLRSHLMATKR